MIFKKIVNGEKVELTEEDKEREIERLNQRVEFIKNKISQKKDE